MKVGKRMVWLAAVLLVGGALACGGGGKYAQAKKLINKQIDIMVNYADAMEKAGNAQDVAAALNAYAAASAELAPEMKKFQEQYPELKNQAEPPVELKPEMEKMQQVMGRIMSASMKAAQYMQDPAVQEAQKKLGEAMAGNK
jgi:hypothetical protein